VICALCGVDVGGDISREHVFAQWIRKLFVIDEQRILYKRGFQERGEQMSPEEWEDIPFNLRVKDLCKPCNNEWCGRIEDEAEPVMTPMIRGEAVHLDARAQMTLAIWAMKTILMLQLTYPTDHRGIPADQYLWFRGHRWLLPNEQIWIAHYDGLGDWPISTHYYAIGLYDPTVSEPPEDHHGHTVSFCVGHLVFRAFGHVMDGGEVASPHDYFHGALRQIWPATGDTVDWPPPITVAGTEGLRALVDAFGDTSAFH
jgi:hypothetical protein